MERYFETVKVAVKEIRFKLKKEIDGLKKGKLFDPFDGLVSGVLLSNGDKISFSNKEYFDLVEKSKQQNQVVCRIK